MKQNWKDSPNLNEGAWKRRAGGFTRLDLATVVGLALLLGSWIGYSYLGERGRVARCTGNLNALGKAMHNYAGEHDEMLPPAAVNVEKYQTTWDLEVFTYLKPGLATESNTKLAQAVPHYFACPSDRLPHSGTMRSYAMSSNDMTIQNWPPGADSATGVGLNWDKQTVSRLLNEDALKVPKLLPGIKLADILAPAETVLLAEMIAPDNVLGKVQLASVSGTFQQRQSLPDGGAKFHYGRLNYLMVDGHVEWLSALQTGALDGKAGIWTLKKGD